MSSELPATTHTVVIASGHAGLIMSRLLRHAGREHVVLERRTTLGGGWQDRWDAFRLVSPNFPEVTDLDLAAEGISTVVWTTGYASDYDWLRVPLEREHGVPKHLRGSTDVPGLTFIGMLFQLDNGSANLTGVARTPSTSPHAGKASSSEASRTTRAATSRQVSGSNPLRASRA
jgi:hypothetical protein